MEAAVRFLLFLFFSVWFGIECQKRVWSVCVRAIRTRHDMVDQQTLTNDSFLVATLSLSHRHSLYFYHGELTNGPAECPYSSWSNWLFVDFCDVTVHKKSIRSHVKQHLDCFSIKQKQCAVYEWNVLCVNINGIFLVKMWMTRCHSLSLFSLFSLSFDWHFSWLLMFIVSFAILDSQLSEHNDPEWMRVHLFKPIRTSNMNNSNTATTDSILLLLKVSCGKMRTKQMQQPANDKDNKWTALMVIFIRSFSSYEQCTEMGEFLKTSKRKMMNSECKRYLSKCQTYGMYDCTFLTKFQANNSKKRRTLTQ